MNENERSADQENDKSAAQKTSQSTEEATKDNKNQASQDKRSFSSRGFQGKKPLPRNVVLVGMTGAGKSTVGRFLAKHIGLGFIDLDGFIEKKSGCAISEIFKKEGEDGFREKEKSAIRSLSGIRNHVIAVGGGSTIADFNWDNLRKLGLTVWLNCDTTDIANRLLNRQEQVSYRPLLADILQVSDPGQRRKLLIAKLDQMLGERIDRYREASLEVRFGYTSAEACALNMIPLLRKKGVVRSHMGLTKHLS